ncbi:MULTISPECIES: ABC transporter ATP-binding protein/permease [unclassified Sphingomonas]|jgi:vitamin B12/bleomycin/antimicrobial peptide transport system ATP-binding/permease protein|uniref:ABC transporter ATP-binding protein/permease n=1 Tax=unclassified Sphingomonas TaxID=196159 RepID=UPI0018E53FD3|nr:MULTISPECIES: ABC transporter ATP-binding protein/permease [unclassified Sphingomonas]
MIPPPANVEETRREAGLQPAQPARERWAHAWRISTRYFVSDDWKWAWFLVVCYCAIEIGTTYAFVLSNHWQRNFYDAIEQRQGGLFLSLVFAFAMIIVLQIGTSFAHNIVGWTLSMRWRQWMTDWYLGRWFARDRFYEIERLRMIDNPDQRIAEDVKEFTSMGLIYGTSPLSILISLVFSLVRGIIFATILLQTSSPISLPVFGYRLPLPGGDLVWFAIVYVLFGTVFITWIGKPFVRRRMREQHYEADFRADLLHVRRNGEQIAFSGAQAVEQGGLRMGFANIRRNWYRLMLANAGLQAGQGVYQQVMGIVPLFLTVPKYFAGAITFGQVQAARDAFTQFSSNLSYIVIAYPGIARQIANFNRLKALDDAIDYERPRGIGFTPGGTPEGVAIRASGLMLRRPNGEPLLEVSDWTIRDGERWVIEGPSGTGKTTLLRAVAGLWPDGAGQVAMTKRGTAMLVPQRLYLPLGTLKTAICFPDRAEDHDDATIAGLLERVRLDAHVDAMHELRMWQDELSPGEQQRVALARILLQCPSLLVLDEATSALDADNAAYFYRSVVDALPDATIVSVVHNEKLATYHTHRLALHHGHGTPSRLDGAA